MNIEKYLEQESNIADNTVKLGRVVPLEVAMKAVELSRKDAYLNGLSAVLSIAHACSSLSALKNAVRAICSNKEAELNSLEKQLPN